MSKEKKISEMENKKEQFVALAKEVYPLIEQIREAMAKSPFGDSASISIGSDGYVEFRPYDSGWRLNRYRCDSTPVAQYEYQEKIVLEEEKWMADRGNHRLNAEIERHINQWYGTVHGQVIKNMYENGSDYESICEAANIDYEDYEEE